MKIPRTSNSFRRFCIAIVTAVALLITGATHAVADTSSTVCDPAPSKYWCFNVSYVPNSGYVNMQYLNFSGGLGGSADYFYVWRDEYWRQDPSTGTFYLLTGMAPSPTHTDCCLTQPQYALGNGGYFISDWAEIDAQMRHHSTLGGFFCGATQTFWLSSPSGPHVVDAGGGGPC